MDYNGGELSKLFPKKIKVFNAMFSFTSTGGKINREINDGHGPYIFHLNGHNHHRIGTLLPTHDDGRPRFAQLYIYDTENEVDNRIHALNLTYADNNIRLLVQYLIAMLNLNKSLVQSFCMARERFNESSMQPVTLRLLGNRQRNAREYNLPTASEVAALVPGDGNPTERRDVIVEERRTDDGHNPMKRISELHPSFMALQYPLLFPYGEDGFQLEIPINVPATTKRKYMSLHEYYCFRLQCRTQEGKTLHKVGRLFHTYCVDAYTAVLDHDLDWYKRNQNTIRSELYHGLHDRIAIGETNIQSLVIYTIEFQKRGLPHCHVLIFLHKDDKISSTDEIDHVISAELPSEVDDPIGFQAVRTHMMHGPCGDQFRSSSCMSRDGCTKGYPKEYCEETFITRNGWPRYKRSNNGRRAKVGQRDTMLDNRFVIPHNIDLIVKYDCHINVEWCNQGSLGSLVKYLFNYLNKGPDHATVVIEGQTNHKNDNNNSRTPYRLILHHEDEIEQYLNCRYISACEACWKLLGFELHYRSIAVERLPFHEEGCNRVYFRDDDDVENVLERATNAMSKFTRWMRANEIYPEGRHLLYADYPTEFTWHASDKEWRPHHAKLFRDTFQYISEDITRKHRRLLNNQQVVFTDREIQNYTLLELETILNGNNKSLLDFPQLPQIDYSLMNIKRNRLIAAERMYNMDEEWARFTTLYSGLNSQQRVVYDNIMLAVNENNGRLFFVYRSRGTGKTYLWKTIIVWIRSMGKIVLSVASSGIASLLLPGGQTAHSRFRIPLELDNESCCGIDVVSDLACLIREASLIIWDEAPLQHRHAFEAIDRTFWDICKHDNPNAENEVFGGKVVVLAINKSSAIWDNCRVFVLTTNMRLSDPSLDVARRDEMIRFNTWLLSMGDGTLHSVAIDNEDEATWVEIPDDLLLPTCEMHVLHSTDIICSTTKNLEEMQTMYPTEFLNTLKFSGVPNHNLELKVGSPVILLRNTGLQRVNKSQGQTFNHVCAYLEKPVFTHGQLYVVSSRVTSRASLRFYIDNEGYCANNLTQNIVYKEVFYNLPIDVIGVLREWVPLQDRVGKNQGCNSQLRKIIIADLSLIDSMKHTNIVVVLTCCKVGPYGGAPQLTTTVSTQFHLNLPIVEAIAYTNRPIHPVIFTSSYLKTEELKVTPISEIYKCLTNGADVGTRYIVYGMVTGIDMNHDWKYIQCTRYKLVITIQDNNEEMKCVLFNSDATLLLGYTVEELITKSINEGAENPDWIVDYFIDSLIAKWVVLGIKIDSYNLSPTYVRRYTVTKYYGDDVNALNKHFGTSSSSAKTMVYSDVSISSSLNDFDMTDYVIDDNHMGSTITEDEEKMMDDLMWGQDIENDASVEDAKVENYQVDESEVHEVMVSEPQVDEVHVDDA
uniref:ATP-dependent DNA helicase n=1 Tax=Tanacetum cinerariifolium TaxID=118510 RepID=A0A6L2LUJ7_TANCI|nr:putative PIF1 DNA helicase/replication protein A1-like protein [Tanacetum cinerariifolium]